MSHIILIVGEELRMNYDYLSYIFKEYQDHFGELGEIKFITKTNKNLPFIIEDLCNKYENICIFATSESFATVAKILATLAEDNLEFKDEILAPSNSKIVTSSSFLIDVYGSEVNLIHAQPTRLLGKILIKPKQICGYFSLFDIDKESALILIEPLANTYEIELSESEIIENWILLKVKADKQSQLDGFISGVKNLFSHKFIPQKDSIEFIYSKLKSHNLKITFAESCTCGLMAAKFGNYSGISSVFDGSIVTYSNDKKTQWLGVTEDVLNKYGAVSEQCVNLMLNGALLRSGADFALAISGIAGPDGGSIVKPVGTIFVGAANKDGKIIIERLLLSGSRNYIRTQSVLSAFATLLRLSPDIFFK